MNLADMYIQDHQNKSSVPIKVDAVEQHYNGKFIGDFCIKTSDRYWSEQPWAIFYNPNPPKPEYSNYFAINVRDRSIIITDGQSAFDEPITGIVADDGEIIFSRYRHNFVTSKDGSVWIDGGRDYTRSSMGRFIQINVHEGQFVISEVRVNSDE